MPKKTPHPAPDKNGYTLLYKKAHRHGHGNAGLVARIRHQKTNATHRSP